MAARDGAGIKEALMVSIIRRGRDIFGNSPGRGFRGFLPIREKAADGWGTFLGHSNSAGGPAAHHVTTTPPFLSGWLRRPRPGRERG